MKRISQATYIIYREDVKPEAIAQIINPIRVRQNGPGFQMNPPGRLAFQGSLNATGSLASYGPLKASGSPGSYGSRNIQISPQFRESPHSYFAGAGWALPATI
ncbi:MAG: hypothetical protein CMN77_20495 [Spirochaetaceae bacterium]|nr:hypothetical protein [Spirochaetaceae bacterium]|tara:strand:+ start:61169 stop:61477 length:309 start_codon:yes stop_codon:yes gene_type:complete